MELSKGFTLSSPFEIESERKKGDCGRVDKEPLLFLLVVVLWEVTEKEEVISSSSNSER